MATASLHLFPAVSPIEQSIESAFSGCGFRFFLYWPGKKGSIVLYGNSVFWVMALLFSMLFDRGSSHSGYRYKESKL
ncbi:hypothetical protein [Candidatus Methylacidiphilum infernorum]|uniref:hypothetical protein n=1 Tax=Candidatus Methylacidiphilum infernorum TaxID=511746 RepID=UPI0011D10524|nr:hypothetical protein [Candidatus Methylacidiphilum infernorum]